MPDLPKHHQHMEARQSDYSDVAAAAEAVRVALSQDGKTKTAVEGALAHLCDLIEAQFAREEDGGYLKCVTDEAPRFRSQVDALLAEHQELLDRAEKLRLLIHSGMETPSWWSCVQNDFETLAARLSGHHHAEIAAMQQAFSQDLGASD